MATATKSLQHEVVQDRTDPTSWRVEAIDYENEGVGYVTLFMGPDAERRANEYAAFKNSA